MKKYLAVVLCFLFIFQVQAQSNWKMFKQQSFPIKKWVLLHPFKAKKAYLITLEAKKVADSIATTNLLDKDLVGGQVDAFRHAYWMATLHQKIGKNAAKSLGKAHERDNFKTFKKLQFEDGILPDEVSQKMDLFNNNIGLNFLKKGDKYTKASLIYKIVNAILNGELKIIKKDNLGNYKTCDNQLILAAELKSTWKNKKCLIFSNK